MDLRVSLIRAEGRVFNKLGVKSSGGTARLLSGVVLPELLKFQSGTLLTQSLMVLSRFPEPKLASFYQLLNDGFDPSNDRCWGAG